MVDVPALDAVFRRLDPADRALLELALRHGLDDEAIAKAAGMPVRRVRRRRRALLARLADEIGLDAGSRDDLLAALLVRVAEEASAPAAERDESIAVGRRRPSSRGSRIVSRGRSFGGGGRSWSGGSRSRLR